MASQETPNYRLSRWAGTDRILVEEFNDNWDKIDTALKSSADAAAAAAAELEICGNCDIGLFTYTGDGKYGENNKTSITFPKMPLFFLIKGPEAVVMGHGGDSSTCLIVRDGNYSCLFNPDLNWNGNQCSFYSSSSAKWQMNHAGANYWVLAFYKNS